MDGEHIFIQLDAADGFAIFCFYSDAGPPCDDVGIGIGDGGLQVHRTATDTDVGKIRTHDTAIAFHHMATAAGFIEGGEAFGCVARDTLGGGASESPDVGDDLTNLRVGHAESRRHIRARDPILNQVGQRGVGGCVGQFRRDQVGRHPVVALAVAEGAMKFVEFFTLLREGCCGAGEGEKDESPESGRKLHVVLILQWSSIHRWAMLAFR